MLVPKPQGASPSPKLHPKPHIPGSSLLPTPKERNVIRSTRVLSPKFDPTTQVKKMQQQTPPTPKPSHPHCLSQEPSGKPSRRHKQLVHPVMAGRKARKVSVCFVNRGVSQQDAGPCHQHGTVGSRHCHTPWHCHALPGQRFQVSGQNRKAAETPRETLLAASSIQALISTQVPPGKSSKAIAQAEPGHTQPYKTCEK